MAPKTITRCFMGTTISHGQSDRILLWIQYLFSVLNFIGLHAYNKLLFDTTLSPSLAITYLKGDFPSNAMV
jgi:hypothetical protein